MGKPFWTIMILIIFLPVAVLVMHSSLNVEVVLKTKQSTVDYICGTECDVESAGKECKIEPPGESGPPFALVCTSEGDWVKIK